MTRLRLTEFLLERIAEDEELAHPDRRKLDEPAEVWWADRMLADCAAKRKFVELALQVRLDRTTADALLGACKTLAKAYSDHPDYKEEWRP